MKEVNISFHSENHSDRNDNSQDQDLEDLLMSSLNKKYVYPFDEINSIPISIGSSKELCFLYFSKDAYNYFVENRQEYFNFNHSFDENDPLLSKLEKEIAFNFDKLYEEYCLEERIKISYEEMDSITPNYSFALAMSEHLKTRPFVKKQINEYVIIKKDILKNLDSDKQKIITEDPFHSLGVDNLENINKILFPKHAKSIHDRKDSNSSDDEDVIEIRESLIPQIDEYNIKSYKDILKQLFKMNDLRKSLINYCLDHDKKFNNNDFEKFVCYLEYFITLFTGIQIKYSIDELGLLNMDFYASENIFMRMAEVLHYIAQFQIRDKSYYKGIKENSELNIKKLNTKQYEEYDFDQMEYFPVYTAFMKSLATNFRRYDKKNDLYHLCEKCENILPYQLMIIECDSSLFRFIDKTRLLYMTLLPILDIGYIEKMLRLESNHINQIFKSCMFLRNEFVLNSLNEKEIIKAYLSPKQTYDSKKLDNLFKNTFGETIGYFYVWISHYLTWLIFPTIIGVIFQIISIFVKEKATTYLDLIFLSIIILWGLYYTEDWSCWQIFYNHIWGINGYIGEKSNLYDDNYNKVTHITFLGIKIEKINNFQKFKNIIISIFTLFFFALFIIFTNIIIFYVYKLKNLNKLFIINYKYQVPILILIIREILSKFIYKITKKLAYLENPTDKDKYLEIVTRKRLILEYINYYFNLYYIAFYHKFHGKCSNDNCLSELNNQLLMLLIADSLLVIGKSSYKYFYLRNTKKSFENSYMKKNDNSDDKNNPKTTSIKFKIYTREEFNEEKTQKIILPIIFHFGYVIQFGACIPISFLFLSFLVIFSRIADALSMVYIFYVKTIEASKGLKGYNRMQTRMLFIGIFTNICIIFYTKGNSFLEKDEINALIITILVENVIFVIFKLFDFVHFPFWFRYKDNIKLRYLKKFGVSLRDKSGKFKDAKLM